MKKIIMACIICVIFICACTIDKNREEKNFSTGSSIESSTAGSYYRGGSAGGWEWENTDR